MEEAAKIKAAQDAASRTLYRFFRNFRLRQLQRKFGSLVVGLRKLQEEEKARRQAQEVSHRECTTSLLSISPQILFVSCSGLEGKAGFSSCCDISNVSDLSTAKIGTHVWSPGHRNQAGHVGGRGAEAGGSGTAVDVACRLHRFVDAHISRSQRYEALRQERLQQEKVSSAEHTGCFRPNRIIITRLTCLTRNYASNESGRKLPSERFALS